MSGAGTWRLAPDVVWREVGGEIVVLDLASAHYHGVDGVGVEIWKLLADGAAEEAIVEQLLPELDVDRETLRRDVRAFLGSLAEACLIAADDG